MKDCLIIIGFLSILLIAEIIRNITLIGKLDRIEKEKIDRVNRFLDKGGVYGFRYDDEKMDRNKR